MTVSTRPASTLYASAIQRWEAEESEFVRIHPAEYWAGWNQEDESGYCSPGLTTWTAYRAGRADGFKFRRCGDTDHQQLTGPLGHVDTMSDVWDRWNQFHAERALALQEVM